MEVMGVRITSEVMFNVKLNSRFEGLGDLRQALTLQK